MNSVLEHVIVRCLSDAYRPAFSSNSCSAMWEPKEQPENTVIQIGGKDGT